jgi:hypothetical protein
MISSNVSHNNNVQNSSISTNIIQNSDSSTSASSTFPTNTIIIDLSDEIQNSPLPNSTEELKEDNKTWQPLNRSIFFEKIPNAQIGNVFITLIGDSWLNASISKIFVINAIESTHILARDISFHSPNQLGQFYSLPKDLPIAGIPFLNSFGISILSDSLPFLKSKEICSVTTKSSSNSSQKRTLFEQPQVSNHFESDLKKHKNDSLILPLQILTKNATHVLEDYAPHGILLDTIVNIKVQRKLSDSGVYKSLFALRNPINLLTMNFSLPNFNGNFKKSTQGVLTIYDFAINGKIRRYDELKQAASNLVNIYSELLDSRMITEIFKDWINQINSYGPLNLHNVSIETSISCVSTSLLALTEVLRDESTLLLDYDVLVPFLISQLRIDVNNQIISDHTKQIQKLLKNSYNNQQQLVSNNSFHSKTTIPSAGSEKFCMAEMKHFFLDPNNPGNTACRKGTSCRYNHNFTKHYDLLLYNKYMQTVNLFQNKVIKDKLFIAIPHP